MACVRSAVPIAWGHKRQGSNGNDGAAFTPMLLNSKKAKTPSPTDALLGSILFYTYNRP
jgi:hypothetical protein